MTPIKAPESLAEIGSLGKRSISENERVARVAFALLWEPTIRRLSDAGWQSIHPGSISQLYAEDGTSAKLAWVLASPSNALLYVRLNFTSPDILRAAEPKFHGLVLDGYEGMTVTTEKTKRTSGTEWFIEARIPMDRLFQGCTTSAAMKSRLAGFVVPLVELAE